MRSLITIIIIIAGMASCKTVQPENNCTGTPTVDCICTKEYLPVCGCDGKTYGNACEARCAGVKTWKEGECGK